MSRFSIVLLIILDFIGLAGLQVLNGSGSDFKDLVGWMLGWVCRGFRYFLGIFHILIPILSWNI